MNRYVAAVKEAGFTVYLVTVTQTAGLTGRPRRNTKRDRFGHKRFQYYKWRSYPSIVHFLDFLTNWHKCQILSVWVMDTIAMAVVTTVNVQIRVYSLGSISRTEESNTKMTFLTLTCGSVLCCIYRVPSRTGKPGKMGSHFPVREKSGKITQNTGKLGEFEINIICYF